MSRRRTATEILTITHRTTGYDALRRAAILCNWTHIEKHLLMQCRANNDLSETCISHDITNVNTITLTGSDGTIFTLVIWQDRDDVLRYRFGVKSESSGQNSGKTRLFWQL